MEVAAAKMIGAGLACIALVGAGIGIGNVFGSYLAGALRNPGAAASQTTPQLRNSARTANLPRQPGRPRGTTSRRDVRAAEGARLEIV